MMQKAAEFPSCRSAETYLPGASIMSQTALLTNLQAKRKSLGVLRGALAGCMLIAAALPAFGASPPQSSERTITPAAEKEPEWSKPVAGLQCRLYVPPFDPKKTRAENALLFELRNAGREPIVLPLASGAPDFLTLHVADYPELQSATGHGDPQPQWQIIEPGKTFSYRVTQDYTIAYGRLDNGQWQRFNPAGKTYEITADFWSSAGQVTGPREGGGPGTRKTVKGWTGHLSSNSVRLPLNQVPKEDQGPKDSRYWPPRPPAAAPKSEWSEAGEHGLQTRLVFLTERPTAGEPIIGRVELRQKDGKDWAANAMVMNYAGDVVLLGDDGKEITRQRYSLRFNTMVPAGRTLTLCQFDLDLKPFLLAKPGKYAIRFAGYQAGQLKGRGATDLPESPQLGFDVVGANEKPAKP
jgi:hypothetical protein